MVVKRDATKDGLMALMTAVMKGFWLVLTWEVKMAVD